MSTLPTNIDRLGLYTASTTEHAYALEGCVRELFNRVEKLEKNTDTVWYNLSDGETYAKTPPIRGEEWSDGKIHAYIAHYGEFPYGMGTLDPSELVKNKPWPPVGSEEEKGDAPATGPAAIPQKHTGEEMIEDEIDAMIEGFVEADKEVGKLYEALALNAAEEYVAHYRSLHDSKLTHQQLRDWGHTSYKLHEALIEAVEALSDEGTN